MKNFIAISFVVLLSACAGDTRPQYRYEPDSQTVESGITPQVYSIAATRAVNKFLDGTKVVYEQKPAPTLYIKEVVKEDDTLPDGFYYAGKVTGDIIEASKSYRIVNNINEASYYLDVWVSRSAPDAHDLTYALVLMTADGQELGTWQETLKRLKNDDHSWW